MRLANQSEVFIFERHHVIALAALAHRFAAAKVGSRSLRVRRVFLSVVKEFHARTSIGNDVQVTGVRLNVSTGTRVHD